MTPDETATAFANVRAFAEAFMVHCPGDLIRSIDPDPGDEAVWPVRLKLTELLAVLDECDDLRARLDTIGLLLPVLTATVTEPRRDARSAELVVKAIVHHHAGVVTEANGDA